MAIHWFIVRESKERGPYSGQQLKEMAATGQLRQTDLVRRDDMQTARPAGSVKGLFASAVTPSPSMSAPSAAPRLPSAAQWYYAKGNERHGPFPATKLRELVSAGQVEGTDLVWAEDMTEWTPASTIPLLADQVPRPQPPTPAPEQHVSAVAGPSTPTIDGAPVPSHRVQGATGSTALSDGATGQGWYYAKGTEKHGPVPVERLRDLAAAGQLLGSDLVWSENLSGWTAASKVPGLMPQPSGRAVPPPLPEPAVPTKPGPPPIPFRLPSTAIRINWGQWSGGGKVIFASTCAAVLTMFMKWVDLGIVSANGFSQMTWLLLGLYAYPVSMLLKNKPIHRYAGIGCAAGAALLAMAYIASKQGVIFGREVNAAGSGPVVFIAASIALIVGVVKYQPYLARLDDPDKQHPIPA
jgi:hypothetical protein